MPNPSTQHIAIKTKNGWRDIPVETRPITTPRRPQCVREDHLASA
jgi:hypothetical protein